jgi:hypothetical protein
VGWDDRSLEASVDGHESTNPANAYNGAPIRDLAAVRAATGNAPKGAHVRLTVERGDATIELTASPGALGIHGAAHRHRR